MLTSYIFMNYRSYLIAAAAIIALSIAGYQANAAPDTPYKEERDITMTDAALEVLETYHKSRPTISDWSVQKNADGSVETGSYRDHKGEVVLKIKITMSPDYESLEVWQRKPWLIFFTQKSEDTASAALTKLEIQKIMRPLSITNKQS